MLLRRALATAASGGSPQASAAPVLDVAIVGAGLAGSALAAALAANPVTSQLRIALLDRQPPARIPQQLPERPEARVAALSPASIQFLMEMGAWSTLAPAAALASDTQVWGSGGGGFVRCSAASVGAPVMACVFERSLVVAALQQRLRVMAAAQAAAVGGVAADGAASGGTAPAGTAGGSAAAGLRLMLPSALVAAELPAYHPTAQQLDGGALARLDLADGSSLRARLLVGADGCGSLVRQLAQIRAAGGARPGQPALWELSAPVSTSWPLQTTFVRFLPTGPLALLPVRGEAAAVWICPHEMAQQLSAQTRQELAGHITGALLAPPHPATTPPLGGLVGSLLGAPRSARFVDPPAAVDLLGPAEIRELSLQSAGRYVRPRLALVGGAAHGSFSLPAWGINLSFAGARTLARAIADAVETGQDIGSPAFLESAYERPQQRADGAAAAAAGALASMLQPQAGPLASLSSIGMDIVNSSPSVKQTLMRLAMHGFN